MGFKIELIKNAQQYDDSIILEVIDKMKNKKGYEEEKCFKANNQELSRVQEFIQNILLRFGCNDKTIMQINLVVEEVFVNIANYAYQNDDGTCKVIVNYDGAKQVMITFEDNGIPFNPLEKEDPDITLSADKREVGGLGIFITKQIMDQVEYTYENQKNVLKITKIL